jgi:hypothetical protein
LEGRAAIWIGSRPQTAAMRLDYGMANSQAHAHTLTFGRKESVEQSLGIRRMNSNTGVLDGNADRIGILGL